MSETATDNSGLPFEGELPSLDGATGWLNSRPLSTADLRGNVVLIDFWTYTCINWLRTLPHIRAWDQRYRQRGLVVIGVHTPEFWFEQDVESVRAHMTHRGIQYPVAIDSDYAIWRAFDNRYWPAHYFVDAQGAIRDHHFGEGRYEQSERVIQQLLAEAGVSGVEENLVSAVGSGAEAPADWDGLGSPETYVGYDLAQRFSSPGGATPDEPRAYTAPELLTLNQWALSGDWTVQRDRVALNEAGGRLAYRFHARDLHLVMRPATGATPVPYRVLLDGHPPATAHGVDVDDQGNGTVDEPRLYQLIRQPGPVTDHTFEVTFLEPGVEAYVFTFG